MPILARLLGLRGDGGLAAEAARARVQTAKAAIARLDELGREDGSPRDAVQHLREHYVDRAHHYKSRFAQAEEPGRSDGQQPTYRELRLDLIDVERQAALDLRDQGRITDETLRRIDRDLDLEEVGLGDE